MSEMITFNIKAARPGQQGALETIKRRISAGEKTTSVVLPTRYGKSDVIRLAAIELKDSNLASTSVLITPVTFLRDQLGNHSKIEEMCRRWSVKTKQPIHFDKIDAFRMPIAQNDEYFSCMTTQMLALHVDKLVEWMAQRKHKTGKPVVVFIDETHSNSDKNMWGATVEKITRAGSFVVLLTATAWRADGDKIPGFTCDVLSEREYVRSIPRPHEKPDKVWVEVLKTTSGKMRLVPDYEYTFKNAWDEGNVLCGMSRKNIDIEVEIKDENDIVIARKYIHEFGVGETLKYLGQICRNHTVIERGVEYLATRLDARRLTNPTTAGIIFCGNDKPDDDDNGHANVIRDAIHKIRPSWRVVVATNKSQEDAGEMIDKFVKGYGDIIIVKQMASLGLDVERLKVVLDLSAVRTLAAWIQRLMRVATIWHGQDGKLLTREADTISPNDVLSDRLFKQLVSEQGGEAEMRQMKSEMLDRYETDKDEDRERNVTVSKVESGALSDHNFSYAGDNEDLYRQTLATIPELANCCTSTKIINIGQKLLGLGARLEDLPKMPPVTNITAAVDVADEVTHLRERINKMAKDLSNQQADYSINRDEWIDFRKKYINSAKQYANVPLNSPLNKIRDLDALRLMTGYLDQQLASDSQILAVS